MVHISKIAKERIDKVEDVLSLGDIVKVVCLGKDKLGRISFSMKDVPKEVIKIWKVLYNIEEFGSHSVSYRRKL